MSDIAHRHVTRGSECVCGSDWNWIADACQFVVPLIDPRETVALQEVFGEEDVDLGYFECRKGHAFCGRH